ncbi:MAG: permease prefix domain 1-containing protein [Candidatus Helarchaeota archaeon]
MKIQIEDDLIQEFLNEIELKLPFWLKYDEGELKNVLDELRGHIEDKTEALETKGEARIDAVRNAVAQMGTPATIAREYKRRGTPKFYITEELFGLYLTVMRYAGYGVGAIFGVIALIGTLVTAFTGGAWLRYFFGIFSNFFILSVIIAAGITVFFVWLSYEGYFPEDLKRMMKFKQKQPPKDKIPPKSPIAVAQPELEMHGIKPSTIVKEREYPKNLDRPQSLISGGIVSVVFGVIAVVQPFEPLKIMMDPVFLQILMGIGFFWIVLGILSIIHGAMVSWSLEANKGLYPGRAIVSLASISMVILLLMNPQAFPIPVWTEETGFQLLSIAQEFYWLYYLIGALIIIGIIAGAIHKIYRAVTLPEEFFFES